MPYWEVPGAYFVRDVPEASLRAGDDVVAHGVQTEQVDVRTDRGPGGHLAPQGLVCAGQTVQLVDGEAVDDVGVGVVGGAPAGVAALGSGEEVGPGKPVLLGDPESIKSVLTVQG